MVIRSLRFRPLAPNGKDIFLKRRLRHTMNSKQPCHPFRISGIAFVIVLLSTLVISPVTAQQPNDQLTGNWAVRMPNADGTFRTTYLNLKQEGSKITGSIRVAALLSDHREPWG